MTELEKNRHLAKFRIKLLMDNLDEEIAQAEAAADYYKQQAEKAQDALCEIRAARSEMQATYDSLVVLANRVHYYHKIRV